MVNPDSSINYEQTPDDIKKARWVLIFTLFIMFFAVFFMVGAWPAATEDLALNATSSINQTGTFNAINNINTTRVVTLPVIGFKAFVGPETLLLLVMMVSGAIGACVFSIWAISNHLGKHHDFYYARYKYWYYTRPFIGVGLALFFYLLIRGGLLTIGAEFMTLNLVVIAGLSGLVGMFSEQAILKLSELADATFGPAAKKQDTSKKTDPNATKDA
jgi:hypothetical protein